MKKIKISVILVFFIQTIFAQNNSINPLQSMMFSSNYWSLKMESSINNVGVRQIIPNKYKTVELDLNKLKLDLSVSTYRTTINQSQGIEIELPNPNGTASKYLVYKNTTMSGGLEIQFPEIRTYDVVSIDNPGEYGKIDITPHGFHAMIFSTSKGTMFIDPYSKGNRV